jgi:DNA-binding transcriptional regulator YbjK
MAELPTSVPDPAESATSARAVPRAEVVDAAARVITRRCDHRVRWTAIAYEAGNANAVMASQWFEDLTALIDECYSRTVQRLSDSLLRAETAPGITEQPLSLSFRFP